MANNEKIWQINTPPYVEHEKGKTPVIIQVVRFLNSKYEIRRNDVKMRVEIRMKHPAAKWKEISDQEIDTMVVQMKALGGQVNRMVMDTLLNSTYVQSFDPIRSYFEDLSEWDGKDYIGMLASTITTTNPAIWRKYLEKWLVALVKSAVKKNVTNQQMLVFFGKQGVGKTRWTLKLLPPRLKDYLYTGHTNLEDQMFKMKLARYLVIFIDELDSYKGNKQAIIKGTVTQEVIRFRPLFQAHDVEVPRLASFIAAINQEAFLHDITGSRRFLVVECLSVDPEHTVDMDNVFSQALYLANDHSYRHYFNAEETSEIESYNERFKTKSDVELVIDQYLEPAEDSEVWTRKLTATAVINLFRTEIGFPLSASPVKVGEAMSKLGFKKISDGVGNDKRTKYLLKLRSAS